MQPLHAIRPSLALRALPVALAVAAAMPVAGAQAQGCVGAPGASALEQYCEAVPRADGGRQAPGSKSSGSGSNASGSGSGVSSSTAKRLGAAGADGAAVQALAGDSTGSSKSTGKPGKNSSGDDSGSEGSGGVSGSGGSGDASGVKGIQVDGPSDPAGSPLKAATNAVASGPTAGGALVWGLVGLSALGAAGAVFLRRGQSLGALDDENDQS